MEFRCPNCGRELSPETKKCSACGEETFFDNNVDFKGVALFDDELEGGGFSKRLIAMCIDTFIIIFIAVIINLMINFNFLDINNWTRIITDFLASIGNPRIKRTTPLLLNGAFFFNIFLYGFVVNTLISSLYFAFFESSKLQATPGKFLLSLKVINEDNKRQSFFQAMLRNVLKVISNITLGIGYFVCLFNSDNQTLHDILSKSNVVRR